MLIRLLSDPNPGVQSSAAFALRKIGTPEAQTALDAARRFKR
jgi:HEAT repeat protein